MSSRRLPGKTLADVAGEPMLELLLRRLSRARRVETIIVATSTDTVDDPVEALAERLDVPVHRGSREDVLSRFVGAIAGHRGPVVRITGDCPLIDPAIVDAVLERFVEQRCAYANNLEPRTYPDGLDVEVVDADALRAIAGEADDPADREHVTSAIRAQPDRFARAVLRSPVDLGDLRWTVDDAADLDFVRAVVVRLGDRRHRAGMQDILAAVRRAPSLASFGGWRRG
jgi:spore coat polysaccharide biosynthesis protein SpsF (cytidylyltransferase family)